MPELTPVPADSPMHAARVLELIAARCGAESGYLYLVQGEAPSLVAQKGPRPVTREVEERVRELNTSQAPVERAAVPPAPSVWPREPNGEHIRSWGSLSPLVLSYPEAQQEKLVGVAVLRRNPAHEARISRRFIAAISRKLAELEEIATTRRPPMRRRSPFGTARTNEHARLDSTERNSRSSAPPV